MNMQSKEDLFQPGRLKTFKQTQERNLKSIFLNTVCDKSVYPTRSEYSALNRSLLVGDPQMEKVVDWVFENPKKNRKMFDTALYKGLDQLEEAVPVLEEFFSYIEKKPAWVDTSRFENAINFTHRLGMNYGFISRDLGLFLGYLYPGLNQPLILTGALNKSVSIRLAETTKWWLDVTEHNGFDRFGKGFTSTIYVRFIHSLVRRQLMKSDKWDNQMWGTPLNQFDMALTNIAFAQVILLGVRALGIFPNKKDKEDFLHFWKYAGWLMGVEEEWLTETESDGWRLLHWLRYAHPKPDESSKILGLSLSQEPLSRQYPRFSTMMPKIAYQQHLGVSRFFLGKKKMRKLGVDTNVLPWFPLMLIPRNMLVYGGLTHLPGMESKLNKQGREFQKLGFALYKPDGNVGLASMHQ